MAMTWLSAFMLGQFAVADVAPAPAVPLPEPAPQAIHKGAKSVSIGFWQNGSSLSRPINSIGGAIFVTDRISLNLQAKVDVERLALSVPGSGNETLTQLSVSLVPAVRYYLNPCRPVASYISLGLAGGYSRTPEVSAANNQVGSGQSKNDGFLDILGAFGAEWFVVPAVSLSGELGFSVQAVRPNSQTAPSFHTLSSLLQANFYW